MTRSLGDLVAKTVGVTCQPEISIQSTNKAKAIVMASDGLWDRLTNNDVALIVRQCEN